MAGLWGFASHGGSILFRGSVATVEAPGYARQPPLLTLARQPVNLLITHSKKSLLNSSVFFSKNIPF